MRLGYLIALVLFAGVLISGMSCGRQNEQMQSLTRHQRLWAQQGIVSYQYRLQVNCFCPPEVTGPFIVQVRDGTPSSVLYAATGKPAESRYFEKYDTIDEMFLVVDDALKRKAAEISVTYNETLGFPTSIYIDFIKQAVDDEIAYGVTEFQTLK